MKRLQITIVTPVPDDAIEQASVLAALRDPMNELKTKINEAVVAAGGAVDQITVTSKVISPPKAPRQRKPKVVNTPQTAAPTASRQREKANAA